MEMWHQELKSGNGKIAPAPLSVTWVCAKDFCDALTEIIIVDNMANAINPNNS
jgi:hypothetical protein